MNVLAFVLAPVAVAVVLFVSGWVKVGDVTGTRLAFVAMKVPAALTRPSVVRALPFAELLLGCALLLTWGWVLAVAAAATTLLFLVYAALVARVLRAGDDVECHCFGTLGDDRVTSVTLARNLVLVLLAALATGFGASGSGVVPAVGDFQGSDWWWPVMTALVVLTALLIFRPGGAADEPPVDDEEMEDYLRQPVPIGFLESEDGRRVQLRDLALRQPQLLIFMSIGCGACHIVAEWLPSFAERLEIVGINTVFTEPLDRVPENLRPGATMWFDPQSEVSDLFASGRPAAVLFGADGMLAGGPVVGASAIEVFVDDIVAELASAPLPEPPAFDPFLHDHDHDHLDHDQRTVPTTTDTEPRAEDPEPEDPPEPEDRSRRSTRTTTPTRGTRDPSAGRGAGSRRSRRQLSARRRALPADPDDHAGRRADVTLVVPNTPDARTTRLDPSAPRSRHRRRRGTAHQPATTGGPPRSGASRSAGWSGWTSACPPSRWARRSSVAAPSATRSRPPTWSTCSGRRPSGSPGSSAG